MGIQICQEETVYRYHTISRKEAIRILIEENTGVWSAPHNEETLKTLSEKELCALLLGHLDEGDDIHDHLDAMVCEKDSSTAWTVEVTS